ncbi:MAG: hypothetical protein ACTSO7_08665 [Candidatus Heimdallarchaeota archaeon]
MSKNQTSAEVPFVVNDTFSYEEATNFRFEGNITGLYSNAFDNTSLNSVNYTVHRWMIDKITGINIKITNITEEDLELAIKQQYTYNSYEEFTIDNNNTLRRTSNQYDYLSQFNVSISIDDFRVSSTTNETYYPFNITTFFWTQSNLTIGEDLEIIDTTYHVENHSLLATYEGAKNVTNLLSGVVNSELFAYSDYLQQFVYLGQFANQTLLSVGRYDGILISGFTPSTFIDSLAFTNAAEGEISIETCIDIVSSSYEDPGRTFGSVLWLVGGLIIECIFIYNFEKNTFKKLRGTQKIDTKDKTAVEDDYVKQLDIYLPHKEQ